MSITFDSNKIPDLLERYPALEGIIESKEDDYSIESPLALPKRLQLFKRVFAKNLMLEASALFLKGRATLLELDGMASKIRHLFPFLAKKEETLEEHLSPKLIESIRGGDFEDCLRFLDHVSREVQLLSAYAFANNPNYLLNRGVAFFKEGIDAPGLLDGINALFHRKIQGAAMLNPDLQALRLINTGKITKTIDEFFPHTDRIHQLYYLREAFKVCDERYNYFMPPFQAEQLQDKPINAGYVFLSKIAPEEFPIGEGGNIIAAAQDFENLPSLVTALLQKCASLPSSTPEEKLQRYFAAKTVAMMWHLQSCKLLTGAAFRSEEEHTAFVEYCFHVNSVTIFAPLGMLEELHWFKGWDAFDASLAKRVISEFYPSALFLNIHEDSKIAIYEAKRWMFRGANQLLEDPVALGVSILNMLLETKEAHPEDAAVLNPIIALINKQSPPGSR